MNNNKENQKMIGYISEETNVNDLACKILRELLLKRTVAVRFEDMDGTVEYDSLDPSEFAHQPISVMLQQLERQIRALQRIDGCSVTFHYTEDNNDG
jgi:hypothetical protein